MKIDSTIYVERSSQKGIVIGHKGKSLTEIGKKARLDLESFFNKKVIVCRKTTERPEAIETGHLHIYKSPDHLFNTFNFLFDNYKINQDCPYGDGESSIRIAKIINEIKATKAPIIKISP